MKCRDALLLVLDQVDYSAGACRILEPVSAVLPEQVITRAHEALAADAGGPCSVELRQVLGNVDFTRHCCRPNAMIGEALDRSMIENARDAIRAAA